MSVQWKDLQIEDFVVVYWHDAEGEEEWQSLEEISSFEEPPLIVTGGTVTSITKFHICISQNYDHRNLHGSHTMLIPKSFIYDLKKIDIR